MTNENYVRLGDAAKFVERYPDASAAFQANQLEAATKYSHLQWRCWWDNKALAFHGYWWEEATETAFVPEPVDTESSVIA